MPMNGITRQATGSGLLSNRWCQLIIGMLCMALVANLQYAWTLFVTPMNARHHWGEASIQLAFAIFILTETWLVPLEGWLVDKFGPRPVVAGGAVCAGLAWVMNSYATTLPVLYVSAVIAGIGAGGVYGTCVGNALKWFPDRRGLAAGLTAAGFGAGAAATGIPMQMVIASHGSQSAFLWFGLCQGLAVLLLSQMLRAPAAGQVPRAPARVRQSVRDYAPLE